MSRETILSVLIGGAISLVGTLAVSWVFYVRAAKQLRDEAARLRTLLDILLSSLEHHGAVTLRRDAQGSIIGYDVRLTPPSGALGVQGATPGVISRPPEAAP